MGRFLVTVCIPVRITDINYGRHLGNDAIVRMIHEARMQWLSSHGYTELDIEGTGLIMGALAVCFRNEGFYGDLVDITILGNDLSRAGFNLYYEMTTTRNEKKMILAVVKTEMICFDYTARKIAAVPSALARLLAGSG